MRYLNTNDIRSVAFDWRELVKVVHEAIITMSCGDFSQPIKPYLRYRDISNRIIAMPAFVGGTFEVAGIKWIASFPGNVLKGLKRAHSITILNEAHTGIPVCIINSPLISGLRTAAVSGLVIEKVLSYRPIKQALIVGICGFGPIGQIHLDMITSMLGRQVGQCKLYDIKGIDPEDIKEEYKGRVAICKSFEECYKECDIFVTATVANQPYIYQGPKPGSLHLNVSLRDYKPIIKQYLGRILVDNWEEVCRENTDIENMSKSEGLRREDTLDLTDIFLHDKLDDLSSQEVLMFNPMGMAIFDIAIGNYYFKKAVSQRIGLELLGD